MADGSIKSKNEVIHNEQNVCKSCFDYIEPPFVNCQDDECKQLCIEVSTFENPKKWVEQVCSRSECGMLQVGEQSRCTSCKGKN